MVNILTIDSSLEDFEFWALRIIEAVDSDIAKECRAMIEEDGFSASVEDVKDQLYLAVGGEFEQ